MRRLVELAGAEALTRMRASAAEGDWAAVLRLLELAARQFAGSEWVSAVLASMHVMAESRSRECFMKESMYSSGKVRSRLVAKEEELHFSAAMQASSQPAHLRRKSAEGKGSQPSLIDDFKP